MSCSSADLGSHSVTVSRLSAEMQATDSSSPMHLLTPPGRRCLRLCVISMRAASEELLRAANGSSIQGPEPSGHARMPLSPGYTDLSAQPEKQSRVKVASLFSVMLQLPQHYPPFSQFRHQIRPSAPCGDQDQPLPSQPHLHRD